MWWLWLIVVLLALAAALAWAGRRRRRGHRPARGGGGPAEEPRTTWVGGVRSWEADEFTFEHEVKRSEAEQASRVADFYARLAGEQEARAEALAKESREAAERAGLEELREKRLEADS